ncbi:acylphosphatase, partial [Desulfurococcus sp.]
MKAFRIVVTGLVQGVGFRPFIDRVVRQMKLNGYVR